MKVQFTFFTCVCGGTDISYIPGSSAKYSAAYVEQRLRASTRDFSDAHDGDLCHPRAQTAFVEIPDIFLTPNLKEVAKG